MGDEREELCRRSSESETLIRDALRTRRDAACSARRTLADATAEIRRLMQELAAAHDVIRRLTDELEARAHE